VGSEETRSGGSRTGSDERNNVVRIPRDWFGPKDDLVPFGPRAWPEDGVSGAEPVDDAAAPFDAETFWGEDADSVHDVVDGRSQAPALPVRHGDRRTLTAAILVLIMAGAGLTAWLSRGSQPRSSRPQVASVRNKPRAGTNRLQERAAVVNRAPRSRIRSRPRTIHRRRLTARTTHPTQVVYRPAQEATPSPSSSSAAAPVASTQAAPRPAASASTAARATSDSQVSQPAFGANGALGPISSPAG
jgi:hypothetical protein